MGPAFLYPGVWVVAPKAAKLFFFFVELLGVAFAKLLYEERNELYLIGFSFRDESKFVFFDFYESISEASGSNGSSTGLPSIFLIWSF